MLIPSLNHLLHFHHLPRTTTFQTRQLLPLILTQSKLQNYQSRTNVPTFHHNQNHPHHYYHHQLYIMSTSTSLSSSSSSQRPKATTNSNDLIPPLSLLYKLGRLQPSTTPSSETVEPNAELNDRISMIRGDITRLKVDAIVNAANS